jgi:hypothetical protein
MDVEEVVDREIMHIGWRTPQPTSKKKVKSDYTRVCPLQGNGPYYKKAGSTDTYDRGLDKDKKRD